MARAFRAAGLINQRPGKRFPSRGTGDETDFTTSPSGNQREIGRKKRNSCVSTHISYQHHVMNGSGQSDWHNEYPINALGSTSVPLREKSARRDET